MTVLTPGSLKSEFKKRDNKWTQKFGQLQGINEIVLITMKSSGLGINTPATVKQLLLEA